MLAMFVLVPTSAARTHLTLSCCRDLRGRQQATEATMEATPRTPAATLQGTEDPPRDLRGQATLHRSVSPPGHMIVLRAVLSVCLTYCSF